MRSSVFPLFPPVVRGTLVLTGWSLHCRITAGLVSMDMPLLVSLLRLSAGCTVRGSTAPVGWSGVSPYFACCPSSSALKRSSFGTSASGFRFKSSRWGPLPGRVCLSPRSDRRLLLHLPGVCFESSRWGHPVGSWFVPDLDRNEDLFGAPSLVVGVWAFAMGSPILGRVALFCALDRNEGFLLSSILSCFAMGPPGGSSVWFPSLDRNEAVFG